MNFSALRTMAHTFLSDACTIAARGTIAYDPDLERETVTAGATVYSGPCQVRPTGPAFADAGEARYAQYDYIVHLPYDTVGVQHGHLVTVTASDMPNLADDQLVVEAVFGGTGEATLTLGCRLDLTDSSEMEGS